MQSLAKWIALPTAALGMLCLAGRIEAQANELLVTVIGTVIPGQDSDSSGILGFGVSPTSGQPQGTAAGQPVTMTFTLNLAQIPPDICANNACFSANRAYYSSYSPNPPPGPNWITATDVIGGKQVPDFAPHGGNITQPEFAQLWTAYGSLPVYNEFDIGISNTVRTIDPLSGGGYQQTDATDSEFLRIDSVTTPFLNGLSLNQSFSWNPSQNDGASIAQIERNIILATCTSAGACTYTSTPLDAAVDVQIDSVTVQDVRKVPEPGTLALMVLGLAGVGLAHRRRRLAIR
jgi:PEP-CTERM motif